MTYSCHQSTSMQAGLSEGSLLYIKFVIQDKLIPLKLQKDTEMCKDRDTMLYIERRRSKVCGIRMSDCACRSVPYKFTCKISNNTSSPYMVKIILSRATMVYNASSLLHVAYAIKALLHPTTIYHIVVTKLTTCPPSPHLLRLVTFFLSISWWSSSPFSILGGG